MVYVIFINIPHCFLIGKSKHRHRIISHREFLGDLLKPRRRFHDFLACDFLYSSSLSVRCSTKTSIIRKILLSCAKDVLIDSLYPTNHQTEQYPCTEKTNESVTNFCWSFSVSEKKIIHIFSDNSYIFVSFHKRYEFFGAKSKINLKQIALFLS